jgi:hypothetical protein
LNSRTPCDCPFCWKQSKMWRAPESLPIIHLVEALADSGNQALVHGNIDLARDRFARLLAITREIIISHPEENPDRCKYIEPGTRAKCGMPTVNGNCTYHGYRGMNTSLDDWNDHPPKYIDMKNIKDYRNEPDHKIEVKK